MRLGITVLRTVVGALFMGHGLQKLAGWFGGYGLKATGGAFEQMGLKPGVVHAGAAGTAETLGGALLMTGIATPAGEALVTGTMTTAIEKVHWQKGIWVTEGGFEYNLVLIAAAFAIADHDDGPARATAGLIAGVAGGLAVAKLAAQQPSAQEDAQRFQREEEQVPTGSSAG
jgi:putative oxidoreductase